MNSPSSGPSAEQAPIISPSSPAVVQAEVDYGSPEQKGSDRGHLTKDAPSKDMPSKDDLLDWEMLSRTPSPAPERSDEGQHSGEAQESEPLSSPVVEPIASQDDLSQQEEAMAASESPEASTEEHASHEEAFMTMDAVPELVQMMTDIQAALTEPEESAELESPTNEAQDMIQDAATTQEAEPNEEISQAIGTPIEEDVEVVGDGDTAQQDDDMAERTPPDSPHVRSGVSSFSHISSPTSYQFSRDGNASDEEGSSWSSDEDDKSRRSGRRSEADSEEAIQDVCALSQEGSLGSFSGSDRSFARRIEAAAESSRTPPGSTAALSGLRSIPKTDTEAEQDATQRPANVKDALKVARCLSEEILKVAGLSEDESGCKQTSGKAIAKGGSGVGAPEEQRWDKKGASRRADVVGALRSGLDKLSEVSNKALARVGNSDLLHRFWACLEEWMSALLNCLPAAQRARARLRMELSRMQARAKRMGWSQIALVASLAIMAVAAGVVVVKNAALSRALRRKDQEMNQLILMVFNLQESLQNAAAGSRVPIVRHASCGLSSFSAYGYAEPVSMLAFEALTGAVQC